MKGWFARIQVWKSNYKHKFRNKFRLRTPVGRLVGLPLCACKRGEELQNMNKTCYISLVGVSLETRV